MALRFPVSPERGCITKAPTWGLLRLGPFFQHGPIFFYHSVVLEERPRSLGRWADRAMEAMPQMIKSDIAEVERAAQASRKTFPVKWSQRNQQNQRNGGFGGFEGFEGFEGSF